MVVLLAADEDSWVAVFVARGEDIWIAFLVAGYLCGSFCGCQDIWFSPAITVVRMNTARCVDMFGELDVYCFLRNLHIRRLPESSPEVFYA